MTGLHVTGKGAGAPACCRPLLLMTHYPSLITPPGFTEQPPLPPVSRGTLAHGPPVPMPVPFDHLFTHAKPIVAVLHVGPSPGVVGSVDVDCAVRRAVAEARLLAELGVDGLLLENAHDVPGVAERHMGPEIAAFLTRVAAAVQRIATVPRAGQLGDRRAAIDRAKITIDDRALIRIGARAIAVHVWELPRVQLVHRLPRELGLVVRAELEHFAAAPVAAAPTWRALAA